MTTIAGAEHGREGSYTNGGCRCAACTAAHTDHSVAYRRARYERTAANCGVAPTTVHDEYTYSSWGCRCDTCTAAHRVATQEKRRKSRAATLRLADTLLDGKLDEYVRERREAGRSWRLISRDIVEDVHLRITDAMLRSWYGADSGVGRS